MWKNSPGITSDITKGIGGSNMIDLVQVDPETWMPIGAPITHYTSLIWSENFFEPSTFELESPAVNHIQQALPIGSLVTLRQSREIMIVETHILETDEEDNDIAKISGRSLTSYTKHRTIGGQRGVKYQAMNSSNLGSGIIMLANSFVNTQAVDFTTGLAATYKNPKDAIPNAVITDSTGELYSGTAGASQQRWLEPGTLDEPLRNFFLERPYGLRILRPKTSTFKVTVTQSGISSVVWTDDIPQLCFDVFKGIDRSTEQSLVAPVIFDATADDLISPNVVRSQAGLKTEIHIALNDKVLFARSSDLSGLDRRVMFLDGGDPESGYDATAWDAYNVKLAEDLLEANKTTTLVDGEVSPQTKLRFGTDYFLGDYVAVRGNYGAVSKALVSEYIYAYGENGYVNYPVLVST
jgi:hypothetical protein